MLKKLLTGTLIAIVMIAIGASAYSAFAHQQTQRTENSASLSIGQDNSSNLGRQGWQNNSASVQGANETAPQGALVEPQAAVTRQDTQALSDSVQSGQGGQGQGQGGQGRGRRWGSSNAENSASTTGTGQGVPQPQNGFTDWITLQGIVSDYAAPNFNLITTDGQSVAVQLGNLSYVEQLGLYLQSGDAVTVTGYYDPSGGFAIGTITLDASGQIFELRDELGRPMWAGGPNQ